MSFRLRSTPLADMDVEDAFTWYESERVGLGIEFLAELGAIYYLVEESPLKYQVLKWDVRRALTRRFPYAVYFLVENESIVVLMFMHAARDPARWQQRRSFRVSE